jgi:ATP-dependent Lon protease
VTIGNDSAKPPASGRPKVAGTEGGLDIPAELAILTLTDVVLFPRMVAPLQVADEKLISLIDDVLSREKVVGVVAVRPDAQKEEKERAVQPGDVFEVGCSAIILKMSKMQEASVRLIVQGLTRVKLVKFTQREPYLRAEVEIIPDRQEEADSVVIQALVSNVRRLFSRMLELSPQMPSELGGMAVEIEEPGVLADLVTSTLNISVSSKQEVLEAIDVKARLEQVNRLLAREVEVLEVREKIQSQVRGEIESSQREYYLREQMKAIQRELGDKDEKTVEIEELRQRADQKLLPEAVRKEFERELGRLERMSPAAAEYSVARTYIDWLLDLPWLESTEDMLDIKQASEVLDYDHYDLEKAKKRIIEYLAVRKLKPDMKGPILCFVGPPGTGKTSLAQSIARAIGRKFVRLSLGGVRDEAEIRGHRRTYVGALPGRIIQGMRRAGSRNPVFILDEIDKVGADFRGDPSSALLEVLDPEQNSTFSDHYLELDFDLSKVMFITTANILDTIPPALRDRMEVLELPGYTLEDKMLIARRHLIPRQLEAHGLTGEHIEFQEAAIRRIIEDYTREAGLRNLEREIASVCRGVARQVAERADGPGPKVEISPEVLPEFLGPPRFLSEVAMRTSIPGVATGMAWTSSGGDIIFVEATRMRGAKNLTLTGQLGDVMKESAMAALSFIRSQAEALGIEGDFFTKSDLHIHVPAGAIPKDGPSAGVTIFCALVSLLTRRPVRPDVAMTGEITLRGLVLPVGGIKEKVLAAKRAGIQRIILPARNEKDLADVRADMLRGLTIHFVERMEEVLPLALCEKPTGKKATTGKKGAASQKTAAGPKAALNKKAATRKTTQTKTTKTKAATKGSGRGKTTKK